MHRRGAALIGLLAVAAPTMVRAGAWPTPSGETQAIFKLEDSRADSAFDPTGIRVSIPRLRDDSFSIFVEHGLTDRLTLQAKVGVTQGEDQFVHYSGRGPVEIGLRYAVIDNPAGVISVYLGAVSAGVGRNAGYAAPHAGDGDVEFRLLAGRNAVLWGHPLFGEVQVAHLWRRGLPDETHVDTTLGWKLGPKWLLLAQTYAGRAEASPVAPEWLKLEGSVVRHAGPWSFQLGWREAAFGRESPVERGPVVGVWRRF